MATFAYTAIDGTSGREDSGVIAGDSESQVVAELKSRGLFPIQIAVEKKETDDPSSNA